MKCSHHRLVFGLTLAVLGGCSSQNSGAIPTAPTSTVAPRSALAPTSAVAPTSVAPTSVATTVVAGCETGQPGLATTVAYRQIDGIDPNLISLDIHAPTNACGAPVVMWVHGGGYAIGDKAQQVDDKVSLFNADGWILVSVNYRLTVPGTSGSAVYPDHYQDVAASVAWVHSHIGDYGGDPTRIALLGHSAGADIVSNIVTEPTYLGEVGLRLDVISCAGPLDTEGFDKMTATNADSGGEKQQWVAALGNNPDYLTATSATRLIRPGIGIPPIIGVIRGTPQRQAIETAFLDAAEQANIPVTRIDARTLSHSDVTQQIGAAGDTVMTEPIMQFLTACFGR